MDDLSNAQSTTLTTSTDQQLHFRNALWDKFKSCSLPAPEFERSLGLFIRGSLLARILTLADVYKKILPLPGDVFDLGTWRGQNAVLSENFRSIFEPFNKQRRIICFDTFEGYVNWSEKDKPSKNYSENTYAAGANYADFLRELLEIHEGNNTLGHVRGMHRIVKGDATQTVPAYLKDHPNTIVSLAFLDLGLYAPTKAVLKSLKPHLIPGSVLLFLQLTRDELPGDAQAFLEVMAGSSYKVEKCPLYPSFNLVTIQD